MQPRRSDQAFSTPLAEGEPYNQAAGRLVEIVCPPNAMVVSDARSFDGRWLRTLLAAAVLKAKLYLVLIQQICGWACRPLLARFPDLDGQGGQSRALELARGIVARAWEAEALREREHHRAMPDAESLWRTWIAVREEVARLIEEGGR